MEALPTVKVPFLMQCDVPALPALSTEALSPDVDLCRFSASVLVEIEPREATRASHRLPSPSVKPN